MRKLNKEDKELTFGHFKKLSLFGQAKYYMQFLTKHLSLHLREF